MTSQTLKRAVKPEDQEEATTPGESFVPVGETVEQATAGSVQLIGPDERIITVISDGVSAMLKLGWTRA